MDCNGIVGPGLRVLCPDGGLGFPKMGFQILFLFIFIHCFQEDSHVNSAMNPVNNFLFVSVVVWRVTIFIAPSWSFVCNSLFLVGFIFINYPNVCGPRDAIEFSFMLYNMYILFR